MKNSKLLLTSLLAAATMSVPAYALVVSNGTTNITEQSNLTGALELRGVYRAEATTVNVLVSTAEDNPLTALIHSKSSGATSGSTATLNIGSATTAVTVVAGRVEFGDVDNNDVSSTLNVLSGSKLVITGSDNGAEYRNASLLLGEWNAKTTLSVSGTMLAQSATALAGDSGMALNISGGTLAVNGIGICQSNKSPASSLSISGNGKLILGDAGISHASGTWSSNLGEGTIGLSSAETTIATNLNFTDATTGTTFDTTQYAFSGEGSAQTISQGATAGTIKLTGTLSGSGIVKVTGSGILDLSGATVSLSSAIQNSATVTVSSDTIFVLSDSLKVGDTGYTYFLISGGAINGWNASTLSAENFRLSGTYFAMREAQANVSTSGQVVFSAGSAGNIVWAGTSGNSTWNSSAENWTLNSAPTKFYTLDNVTFKSLENVVTTVTLENGADIKVGDMTVESGDYTLNAGAGNSATISGATLTVASGATLTLSNQLKGEDASALRLGFEDISLSGTIRVNTNSTDSWSSLTFATGGANLHLYDIGGNESTTGFTIASIIAGAAGTLSSTWGGKMEIGALSGSGNVAVTLTETTQWSNNLNVVIGDLSEYSGTLTLTDTATSGALTLSVSSEAIAGTTANIVVGADTTLAVTEGANNSASGVNDLTNVTGSGKIEFAAAGHTIPGTNADNNNTPAYNASFSWVKLSDQFTGTLSITSGVVDMLSQQGTENGWNSIAASSSAIDTTRLGRATLIELNGGGIQFRNANNTDSNASGYADVTFDKAISVGTAGGAIRLYGNGNVTLKSNISGAGTLSHTDGGTLTLAGTVNLTGGFTNAAGTTKFTGNTTIGTLNVSGASATFSGASTTITTANISGGTLNLSGTTTVTDIRQGAGTLNINGTTTATSLVLSHTNAAGALSVGRDGVLLITGDSNSTDGSAGSFMIGNHPQTNTVTVDGVINLQNAGITVRDGNGEITVRDGGEMNFNAGLTVAANGDRANAISLTLNEGGRINIGGTTSVANSNVLSLTLNGGTIGSLVDSWSSDRAMTIGGAVTFDTAKMAFNGTGKATATDGGSNVTLNGVISDAVDATGSLKKTGAGTLTLNGNNTFSGGVKLEAGTLELGHNNALGTGEYSALIVTGNSELKLGGGLNVANDVLFENSAEPVSTLTINVAADTELSGGLISFDQNEIRKVGAGTLTLSGNNQWFSHGTISIEEGTILAKSANALGAVAEASANKVRLSGGQLEVGSGVTLAQTNIEIVLSDAYSLTAAITGDGALATGTTITIADIQAAALAAESALANDSLTFQIATAGSTIAASLAESNFVLAEALQGTWQISDYADGVLTIAAIPEPSVFGLLAGLGALALAGTRRRRKKA